MPFGHPPLRTALDYWQFENLHSLSFAIAKQHSLRFSHLDGIPFAIAHSSLAKIRSADNPLANPT